MQFGKLRDLGADALPNPFVIGAWLDKDGRCVYVITGRVIGPEGQQIPLLTG